MVRARGGRGRCIAPLLAVAAGIVAARAPDGANTVLVALAALPDSGVEARHLALSSGAAVVDRAGGAGRSSASQTRATAAAVTAAGLRSAVGVPQVMAASVSDFISAAVASTRHDGGVGWVVCFG